MNELSSAAGDFLIDLLSKEGKNTFVVPGGKTPTLFYQYLKKTIDNWDSISFVLSDERVVEQNSIDSNYFLIKNNLLYSNSNGSGPDFHPSLNTIDSQFLLDSFNDYYYKVAPVKAAFLGIGSGLVIYGTLYGRHVN